ncbi:MAG TPA: cytochrome D1 domain-containing protein [Sphingomicrobium sp.]|jgi:YVTN family beta-propeller protein|nr:cytochrome D1 domain-containing protein [Sphingomicrobium sp.]
MRRLLLCLALALGVASVPAAANPLLIVGNKGEDSISFVDLVTGRELARRETGPNPHEIALSPDGKRIAVVAYGGSSIDIFDVERRERVRTVALVPDSRPHGILWLPDGRIIATTEGARTLSIVSPDQERVSAIPLGQDGGHMVAVSPNFARAFVANIGSGTVSVIDLARARKLRDLPVGSRPEGIAVTPDGRQLWVSEVGGDAVHVIDAVTLRPMAKLATGKQPIRVIISPDGRTAVTSNYGEGTLSLFDTATLRPRRTITVSGQAQFGQVTILFDADGRRLYVAETGIDRLAELDMASGTVIGRLPAGKNGDGLAIVP